MGPVLEHQLGAGITPPQDGPSQSNLGQWKALYPNSPTMPLEVVGVPGHLARAHLVGGGSSGSCSANSNIGE